jgi:hypothetical protein
MPFTALGDLARDELEIARFAPTQYVDSRRPRSKGATSGARGRLHSACRIGHGRSWIEEFMI